MRRFLVVIVIVLFSGAVPILAQQSNPNTQSQAIALLSQAATALSGAGVISDVTLTGTVQSTAGSDSESGTVVLKAMAAGESRMDLTLSASSRSEIRNFDSANSAIGAWSGTDGVQHPIFYHNLLTDPSWFFPAMTVSRILKNSTAIRTYVGEETFSGQTVLHISFCLPPANSTGANAGLMQHLAQMDLYLNPTTYLPVGLSFTTHPDNNALVDIPVQIQFSNYQSIGGVQVPFHVQKFLNGTLSIDAQLQTAVLNSGLTSSDFSVQVQQ
jgi:hypothetical protein